MEQLKRDICAAVVGFFFGCGVSSFICNIARLVMRL
nr:MAG TPA: hypothetical protein [Caudoviricetes sp.]